MSRIRSAVGIDLDGVVADIVHQIVEFSRTHIGLLLTAAELRSENVETCTPLTREQLVRMFTCREFFRRMPMIEGAKDAVAWLRDAGFSTHFITDRFWYPEIEQDTREWLHFNGIAYESLNFARKADKHTTAVNLGLKWFVEDQLSNARLLSSSCHVLLVDTPYNQGATTGAITRVATLKDAVDALLRSNSRRRPSREELRCT